MMNKYSKFSVSKIIMLVVIVGLIIAAVGLLLMIFGDSKHQERLGEDVGDSIMFGICSGDVNKVELSEDLISVSYLENYNAEVRNISSGYYFDILKEEKENDTAALYNAMLYAYNNGFNYLSIPADTYDEDMMEKAVYYATCDLPIIDLETVLGVRKSSVTLADGTVSERYYLYLPTGGKGYVSKKKTAIDAARKIVDAIPEEYETELQKAEYLHDWLVTNVELNEEAVYEMEKPHYLYDAFMTNSTNYSGFSQAYSLLLNLTGIKGFRVIQSAETSNQYAWNIAKVDGKYYQTDCAADARIYGQGLGNLAFHFCISAEAMAYGDYQDILQGITPACDTTDRDEGRIDLELEKLEWTYQSKPEMVALVDELEDGAPYVTIRCEKFDDYEWEDNFGYIDYWFDYCTIEYGVINVGKYICLIYPASQVLR